MATVVAAGLTAFASAPPQFTDEEAIYAAERALQGHKMLAADLRHGLGTLSSRKDSFSNRRTGQIGHQEDGEGLSGIVTPID